MKKVVLLGVLFIVSCANITPINKSKKEVFQKGESTSVAEKEVRIQDPAKNDESEIESKSQDKDNSVSLFDSSQGVTSNDHSVELKKVGVEFGPGIYHSLANISFLKMLERTDIEIVSVSGKELGAVVAALYASGMTAELIEWEFFRFINEVDSLIPYSEKWIKKLDEVLLSKLKGFRVENLKVDLALTAFDESRGNVVYFRKGDVRELLLSEFKSAEDVGNYSTSMMKEVFNPKLLKQLGAEFVIDVDVLGKRSNNESDEKKFKLNFETVKKNILSQKKQSDFYIAFDLSQFRFDDASSATQVTEESYRQSLKIKKQLLQRVKVQKAP